MDNIISSKIGVAHLALAIFSMILGPLSVLQIKGSKSHKVLGYLYLIGMIGLNVTALMIYELFGRFGTFHFAAVISLATVMAGFFPVYFKKPAKGWMELHYEFMNWSVIGLYAAFWAEIFTHFFRFSNFLTSVVVPVAVTIALGGFIIKKKKKRVLLKSLKMYD